MSKTKITKDASKRTLTLERVFDAPIERVWKAWTTDEINNWFGPRGWETTSKHQEVVPGGSWHYCMKCVDENQGEFFGQESWGKAVFEVVEESSRIVYTDVFTDEDGNQVDGMPVSRDEITFIKEGDKTRLVSVTTFESDEDFKTVIDMGVEQGIDETWERLAETVEQ